MGYNKNSLYIKMSKKESQKIFWTHKDDIRCFCFIFGIGWIFDRLIYDRIEKELNGKTEILKRQPNWKE